MGAASARMPAAPLSRRCEVPLSHADLDLLRMLASGAVADAVARKLRTSERTVRRHIRNICDELGVATPIEAVVWAAHRGLL